MKKIILIGAAVASLTALIVFFALPVLAQGPGAGGATPPNQDAWQAMHEACLKGDWEAMARAAEEIHSNSGCISQTDEYWDMYEHMNGGCDQIGGSTSSDEQSTNNISSYTGNSQNGKGGMMGGGMMSGGMMGW